MPADALSANVVIPENAADPIEVYIDHAALCVAVVERDGVHALRVDWDVPGVYILLDPPSPSGKWGSYVGKAPAGIRSRLMNHGGKDHWSRTVLVRRDTKFGFHSAQVGWLEGRLYDLLQDSGNAVLHNRNRPSDETLPPLERQMLESCIMPVTRVLRMIGYDPASVLKAPSHNVPLPRTSSNTPAKRTRHAGTVQDLIKAGLITAPARLLSTSTAHPGEATVLPDGRIEFKGQVFTSPSGAADALVNGSANGWITWAIETSTGRASLAELRAHLNADSTSA